MAVNISVNIEETKLLNGNKAIKSLDKYILNLEKQNGNDLTEKHVYTRIKTAKILRTALSQLR